MRNFPYARFQTVIPSPRGGASKKIHDVFVIFDDVTSPHIVIVAPVRSIPP